MKKDDFQPPGALIHRAPVLPPAAVERLQAELFALWGALESPESRRSYRADWRRWCDWLMRINVHPLAVTTATVQRYLLESQARGLASATRARTLSVLRETYGAIVRAELMAVNPAREAKNIRVSRAPRTPWLSVDELATLIGRPASFATPIAWRDWLVLVTLMGSGLRRAEVARLACEQILPVDARHFSVRVRVKGGKEDIVAFPSWLVTAIGEWRATQGIAQGPLFPRYPHAPRTRVTRVAGSISGKTVWRIVKEAAGRTGVSGARATPHAIRRSYVTILGQRGVDIADLQAALLHAHQSTTERYNQAARAATTAPGEHLEDIFDRAPTGPSTSPPPSRPGPWARKK